LAPDLGLPSLPLVGLYLQLSFSFNAVKLCLSCAQKRKIKKEEEIRILQTGPILEVSVSLFNPTVQ
jgi:hypothetical protein